MTLGNLITKARLERRQNLRDILESLRTGNEPDDETKRAAWRDMKAKIEAELKILEAQ